MDKKLIIEQKLQQLLSKGKTESESFISGFQQMSNNLHDYLIPVGQTTAAARMIFHYEPESNKVIARSGLREFDVHPFAFSKISSFYHLPGDYMRNLLAGSEEQRELAAFILNRHNDWEPEKRRLIRVVNGQIRGFVSDRYKRLNSLFLISSFLKGMRKFNAEFSGALLSDTRFYIEGIIPKVIWVDTPNNGNIGMIFGARLSNSDFGNGSLDVRAFGKQVICSNGMVGEKMLSRIHMGGQLPENLLLSQKTYLQDSKTQASVIEDITNKVFDEETIQDTVEQIQLASAKELDFKSSVSWLSRKGLQQDELVELDSVLTRNDMMDGMEGLSTYFKVSQAIGTVGRNKGGEREQELNEIAGEVLTLAK